MATKTTATLTCRVSHGELAITRNADGAPTGISGYAAVFFREGEPGTEYEMGWANVVERIDRHAFDRAILERHDVRALYNHNENFILGRTSSGTLKLSVDDIGLRYDVDIPDTTWGRDVMESIRRGDLTGSSFSFFIRSELWEERDGKPDLATIKDLDLFDVGPVTFPAYEGTSTGVRSGVSISDITDRKKAFTRRMEARQAILDRITK